MSLIFISQICLLFASTLQFHQSVVDGEDKDLNDASSWPGHLKPLGSEAVRLPISELNHFPSPTEFFQQYVYPSIPVVFRHGAKRSPAYEKWTDEYLKSLPESQEMITVETRKVEDRSMPGEMMPFAEFLDRYTVYDEYLISGVPEVLKKDVLVPPPLLCDNITANFFDAVMWFSSGGTKSVLHNDDVDNLNCLFSGQKEILFVNYTKYRHQVVFDHPEGSFSGVGVERVDFNKYPEFRDVEFFEARLEAGDCIYIPYKWYHQVNSIGRNLAVNIWWNHKAYILPTPVTCGNPDPELSLADVRFYYHDLMNNDEEVEEMVHPELLFVENPGQGLAGFMEEEETETLSENQLIAILAKKLPMLQGGVWNQEALAIGHEMFQQFDVDEDRTITSRDLEELPNEEGEGSFGLRLQQQLMMLIDVIDEEIAKEREKQLLKMLGNATATESDMSSTQSKSKLVGAVDKAKADKEEL